MTDLLLLCGPIASGKSTLSRSLAKDGAVIVNDDAIVTALHGGDYLLYDEKFKPLYKSIETHIIMTALSMGLKVVVDRPCYKKETRQRYISLARSLDKTIGIYLTKRVLPEIHARRRFDSDHRGHSYEFWLAAAKKHEELWETISTNEDFDNIEYELNARH